MPAWSVDGMDVVAVEDAARRAVAVDPRAAAGPCFLELRTYRFRAHSMYDPELYRTRRRSRRGKRARSDRRPRRRLRRRALDDDDLRRDRGRVAAEIDDAVAFAEAGTLEPVDDLTRFVYSESRVSATADRRPTARRCGRRMREALQRDERVFLMGEDVGPLRRLLRGQPRPARRVRARARSATRRCRSRRSSAPASARRSAGCARSSRS